MLKAKDLVGKTYSEAYSKLGLEAGLLDRHNGDLEIRDIFEAESVLGIYEALQPETNSPTLTEKYSRLRTLSNYLAPKLGKLRYSKAAAVATAVSLAASVMFSGLAKDLSPGLSDIVMDAEAQDDTNDGTYKIIELTKDTDEMANLPRISEDLVVVNYPLSDEIQILNLDGSDASPRFSTIDTYQGSRPADIDIGYLGYITPTQDISLINTSGTEWHYDTLPMSDLKPHNIALNYPIIVFSASGSPGGAKDRLYVSSTDGKLYAEVTIAEAQSLVNPDIVGYDIVFENLRVKTSTTNAGSDIYLAMLDLDYDYTVQQISPESSDGGCTHGDPTTWGKYIAWGYGIGFSDNCDLGEGIYVYNRETQKIETNLLLDNQPESLEIYKDTLVWTTSYDGIHILDISTGKRIRIPGDHYSSADISGNKVVWSDGADVYLAEFSFNNGDDDPIIPNDTKPTEPSELEKLVEQHAPTYLFSKGERYFPTDPYADDSDVTNNALKWRDDEFPKDSTDIYYAVTDYSAKTSSEHPEGFKVIQYWSYYVYNDWGSDDHEYDWEVIHKWVDNKNGKVFHTATSMHLWDNNYPEDLSRIYVEEGGHGMSKDIFMLDHVEMDFNDVGEIRDANTYELRPLEDLLKYNANDFFGERGKFPTDQDRYKYPDTYIRLNPTRGLLTQFSIKNSPELSVIDSAGRTTEFQYDMLVETIPNSKYFSAEKIIVLGDQNLDIRLVGTANEDYILEVKKVNGTTEVVRVKHGSIKKGERITLGFSDVKDDTPNYAPIIAVAGAVGAGGAAALYWQLRQKPKQQTTTKTPKRKVHTERFDQSEHTAAKSERTLSFEESPIKDPPKTISFADFDKPKSKKHLSFEDFKDK